MYITILLFRFLYVYHYEDDGAWQFSDEESCNEEDYRIISLEEMIEMDNSILELANMPLGYYAKRNNLDSAWEIECIESITDKSL